MPPSPLLVDLSHELLALWHSPEQERRRRLWADHFNGRTRAIPTTCAMFQGWQDLVWEQILPEETFHHKEGMARVVEMHLRHRLWRAKHLADDTPQSPTLHFSALPAMAADEPWGVPLEMASTGMAGGAYKPKPPLQQPEDIRRLRAPEFRFDADAVARQEGEVRDVVGDLLPMRFRADALHNGPFEWAVRLRGMDNLLLDCYDRPEWLKELMGFLSDGIVRYHQARADAGMVDPEGEGMLHSPWDEGYDPDDAERDATFTGGAPCPEKVASLSASRLLWGYLHAQSAASYGPAMYAEFVQPFNVPIAELFPKVYYHGCEDLTQKVAIIRDLPNLREFHVSPWSQVGPIAAALPEHVVLEVHSHPTNVLFLRGAAEMREELRGLVRGAGGHPLNLKLCDIQTINGDGGQALMTWSRVAAEVAAEAAG